MYTSALGDEFLVSFIICQKLNCISIIQQACTLDLPKFFALNCTNHSLCTHQLELQYQSTKYGSLGPSDSFSDPVSSGEKLVFFDVRFHLDFSNDVTAAIGEYLSKKFNYNMTYFSPFWLRNIVMGPSRVKAISGLRPAEGGGHFLWSKKTSEKFITMKKIHKNL